MVAEPIDLAVRRRLMAAEQKIRKTKGSISGDAQMILDALDDLRLPESFKPFIKKIRQSTYYKAGFHVDDAIEGIEEHSCYFSLAAWAKELGMSRQQLYNLRTDLIEHHVITYAPIPEDPHHGIIAWNLSVSEWVTFSKGGKRQGAGRPKKNQSVYANEGQENIQSVYEGNSIGVQKIFNQCTTTPDESGQTQAATPPLRNLKKQQKRNDLPDANASVGVTAALPDVSSDESVNEVTEDSPEYKLASYLYDAIKRIDEHAQLPYHTIKGLSTWIDPPKGKGLRQLLVERGDGDERKDIRHVIDWLARPETSSFWQTRFINRKNNPGKILYDNFSEMRNASTPRQRGSTNGQRQQSYPISSRTQTSRHRQMATSSQRESRPGDDE